MDIRGLALSLVERHGTRNPFKIADDLDYIIICTPLAGIRGLYQYLDRSHIIYLDNALDEKTQYWVCAHELGHSFLHGKINRIFMDTRTFAVTSKFERDADRFASELLFDDYDIQDLLELPIAVVASCLGISEQLAAYRMQTVQPTLLAT